MFRKLFSGLKKTREAILGTVQKLVNSFHKIDEEFLTSLEKNLLSADVGVKMTETILKRLKENAKEINSSPNGELNLQVEKIIQSVFTESLQKNSIKQNINHKKPHIILIVGVNGVGKTTTIGKLAHKFVKENKKVVIGAADTFRAAANEQLNIWANRAKVNLVQQKPGADPAAVAFDTISSAKSTNADVVLIDTAGRLHTKSSLMEELSKIKRVIKKTDETAPHEILIVLDASIGQNGLAQAKEFNSAVGLTGIILTKLDGTAKGGIVFSIVNEFQIPIKYIGVGEGIDDIEDFNSEEFIQSLFIKNNV
ncbi:MAG: signal recognition particle-docking protein FtsY [Bacteroidota bacterium]